MALRKQAAKNKEESQPIKYSGAQKISVHRFQVEGDRINLDSSCQNRCLFLANFCEALIFWYFFIKKKVQKTKKREKGK